MTEQEKKQQTIQWIVTGVCLALGFYNHLALINNWPHLEVVDTEVTRYVTWFYELIVGAYAFWINNNITSPAQLVQILLNKIKNSKITYDQAMLLVKIADKLQANELTAEQLEEFIGNPDLKEITNAHLSGETIEVNIKEGV